VKTKPIVRWPGGKTRHLKSILPKIRSHRTYVEAFGGGLAVLLAKEKSAVEIVNDINGELVSLYRCCQFHLEALLSEIEWTLSSRENLAAFVAQPGLTEIQRAARFLLRNRMSFGGNGKNYAVQKAAGAPSRQNVLELLHRLNLRLDKVSVENIPYERLFQNYDSPETFWFLDPPYSAGEADNYAKWSNEQMAEFAARVHRLRGDWLVTINDCPLNRKLFSQHEIQPVTTHSGTVNRKLCPDATFGELIIRRETHRPATAQAMRMAA